MNKNTPILHFKNVSLVYDYIGGKRAVDIDELKILRGDNTVIFGPNGSGKSSFVRLIMRKKYPELKETPVKFEINGRDDWNVFELRRHMGIVSPEMQMEFVNSVLGDVTVMESILSGFFSSLGLWRKEVTPKMKKKALETLELLWIESFRDRSVNAISTGEARTVLIARALAHGPDIMLLDEPTSGLDFRAAANFKKILSKIARTGTSIILVTHKLEDIIPEIKRAVLFKDGRIFKDGVVDKILTGENLSRLYNARIKVIKDQAGYKGEAQ